MLGASDLDVRTIAELNVRVGEAFAAACLATLNEVGLSPEAVDVIGSHGQTVYHHSGVAGALRATLQVGDGDVIAVRTGRYVLADFRARDIAAGGEGDAALTDRRRRTLRQAGSRTIRRAGARSSILAGSPTSRYSTTTRRRFSGSTPDRRTHPSTGWLAGSPAERCACDQDGRIAASGRVNQRLLAELLETDPFLTRRPPKSTGFEMYGDAFVARAAERHGGHDADLMSTLIEFIARTIAWGSGSAPRSGVPWSRSSWPAEA